MTNAWMPNNANKTQQLNPQCISAAATIAVMIVYDG
jgi:hypothetical protein